MARRRRKRQDPAKAPRRARPLREEQAAQEQAARDLARIHDSLARTTSIMGAATVYFGAWILNAFLGLFPPPRGADLTHPQFLIGLASLIASFFVARYLVRAVPVLRVVRYGAFASGALGVVLLVFLGLAVDPAGPGGELTILALGIGVAWLVATLWLVVLGRRARRLAGAAPG